MADFQLMVAIIGGLGLLFAVAGVIANLMPESWEHDARDARRRNPRGWRP